MSEIAIPSLVTEGDLPTETPIAERVLRNRPGWISVNWGEMWNFRELLYFLVWRDVKVRYKQTALGVGWAILVPVFSMVIFTVIFGNFAGMKSKLPEGMNYAVFVYAGLLPWTFFSTAVTLGGQSLINQQSLLTKIYFPRLFVPTSIVGGALVDMALSFGVMVAIMMWYHVAPTMNLIALFPLMILLTVASLGIAFSLSALTVMYRDFRFLLPFMVQAWQYLSPVMYPVQLVPPKYQWLMALNPMCGIIDGFRSALLGQYQSWQPLNLFVSTLSSIALFVFGMYYFRKTERRFADIA